MAQIVLTVNYNEFIGTCTFDNKVDGVYKYRFIIRDNNGMIFDDSDWRIHNSSTDIIVENKRECNDTYTINKIYDTTLTYTVEYKAEFMLSLGIENTSAAQQINLSSGYPSQLDTDLNVSYDRENACVNISMKETQWNKLGYFKLLRADSDDNYSKWVPLKKFAITDTNQFVYQDRTIKQGSSYIYAYQEYDISGKHSMIYGQTSINNIDFDYAYLGDKNRQIKLAYDNDMSSFKDTILESKVDTLGSKYPFFFRNGNVQYKEFPIGGLISYHLDDNELFMPKSEIGIDDIVNFATTNQEGYNFTAERKFRLELLDWLNNGEEKLYRSPSEGNCVVRLMNVSLSPKKELSRLVSSFSSTAYECASADIEDIVAAGRLVDAELLGITSQVSVIDSKKISDISGRQACGDQLVSIHISGAIPGTKILLYKDTNPVATYTIGMTGALVTKDLPAANSFEINATVANGVITYTHLDTPETSDFGTTVYTLENKMRTVSPKGADAEEIDCSNILEIYYIVFETIDIQSDSWFKINNGDYIHYKGVYNINPISFGRIKSIKYKNSNVTLYYKEATEVK